MRVPSFLKSAVLDAIFLFVAYQIAIFPYLWLDIYWRRGASLLSPNKVTLLALAVHLVGLLAARAYQPTASLRARLVRTGVAMLVTTGLLQALNATSLVNTYALIFVVGSSLATIMLMISRSRALLVRIGIAAVVVVVMLIPLEFMLRAVIPQPRFSSDLPYYPHLRQNRTINIIGVKATDNIFSTNAWGFRGEEPPVHWEDRYTIITVGGSTTICAAQDDTMTYPAAMGSALQATDATIWVNNAGIDGHTSRGNLRVMDEVIRYLKPDLVVVLVGANDLTLSLVEDRRANGSPFDLTAKQRDPLQETQIGRMAWNFFEVTLGGAVPVNATFSAITPIPMDASRAALAPADRDGLPQLPEYRQNLNRLIDLTEEMGTRIVLLTQPSLFDDTPYWAATEATISWAKPANLYFSGATYWKMLAIYNQETLAICEARGIPCLDLAAQIPHNREMFYDSVHFTDAGAERVGKIVAQFIADLRDKKAI